MAVLYSSTGVEVSGQCQPRIFGFRLDFLVTMQTTLTRLKALADPARLQLVQILAEFPDAKVQADPRCSPKHGVCACHLEERLDLSAPTISHHLKVLREAELVEMVKLGRWTYYRLQAQAMDDLLAQMGQLRPISR